MITSGSMFDPSATALTPFNLVGVLLATAGIFLYNTVKDSEYLQQQIQIGMGKATQTLGLHLPLPAWLDAWAEKQTGLPTGAAALPVPPPQQPGLGGGETEGLSLGAAVFWIKITAHRLIITFVPADHWLLGRLSLYSRSSMRRAQARTSPAPSGGASRADIEAAVVGVEGGCADDGLSDAGSTVGLNGGGEESASLLSGVGWSSATNSVSGTLRSTAANLSIPPDRGVAGWAQSQHHPEDGCGSSSAGSSSVPGGQEAHGGASLHAGPGPGGVASHGGLGYRAPVRVGVAGGAGAVPLQDVAVNVGGGRPSRTGTGQPGPAPPASPAGIQGRGGSSGSPYMLMGSPVPMTPLR